MKVLMMCFIALHWEVSLNEILIMEHSKISKEKILMTIKTPTRTGCWIKCQATKDCETIGIKTEEEHENGFFICYLLRNDGSKPEMNMNGAVLNVTEIRPFPVSAFLISEICCCICLNKNYALVQYFQISSMSYPNSI